MSSDLPTKTSPPPTFSFYLDWTIRLLSLIAALLFGIWAPLAYTATLVANRDADSFQTALSQRLDELAAMQRTVHQRLHELEMLKVWEFCAGPGAGLGACEVLIAGKGNETAKRLGKVIENVFVAPEPTTTSMATISPTSSGVLGPPTSGGGIASRATSAVTTIPTASASPTFSTPVGMGDPGTSWGMNMRGLGAAAGVIGFVALLAFICMRSRSSVYRAYHRV